MGSPSEVCTNASFIQIIAKPRPSCNEGGEETPPPLSAGGGVWIWMFYGDNVGSVDIDFG